MNLQNIRTLLQYCLNQGISRIGQIELTKDFRIFHADDTGRSDLQLYKEPDTAQEIARYDDAGKYRPLKTAPNLRHGWELQVASIEELHLALDFFYPAALGLWLTLLRNQLIGNPLRRTLERQSGMYRITAKMTDAEARDLIQNFCETGCLRRRRWDVTNSNGMILRGRLEIPLICSEACHLFVAEARRMVKVRSS